LRRLLVTIAQLAPYIANPSKNVERISSILERAAGEGSDLVVFPELYLHGYYSKDLIYRLAEPPGGENIRAVARAVEDTGVSVVVGFVERDTRYEVLYNSAALIRPDGSVSVYRKRHLPDFSVFDEKRYFRRWEGELELWGVKGWPIGPMICFDIFFPELARAYAYMGAKALVVISAAPDFSHPLFRVLTRARAIENTVYLVWVNMVGTFDGVGFAGGSCVVDPLGEVVYEAPTISEDVRTVPMDPGTLRLARERRPVLRELSRADVEALIRGYRLDGPPPRSPPRSSR